MLFHCEEMPELPVVAAESLHQFIAEKGGDGAVRFDLNQPSLFRVDHSAVTAAGPKPVSFSLLSLPIYFAEEAPRLIGEMLSGSRITHGKDTGKP